MLGCFYRNVFLLEVNQKYKFELMACAKSKPKLRPKPVKRNDADSTYHEAFLKEGMFFFSIKRQKEKQSKVHHIVPPKMV